MNIIKYFALFAVFGCCVTLDQGEDMAARHDIGHPEQELFLPAAAKAMKVYRESHGEYSREWRLLDITFAMGGYYTYETDVRPWQQNKEFWQPRDCKLVYQIVSADKDHFLIQALGWEDKPVYEIRDSMDKPKSLPEAEKELPKLNASVPEPKQFLSIAANAMRAYRAEHGTFTSEWRQLTITFSAIPYHIYDFDIRPREFDRQEWQPRGCKFIYQINSSNKDHFLIQAIDKYHRICFDINESMKEPKVIP
jgi:hypothetical protein